MIYTQRGDLVVAEHHAGEQAVANALRQIDDRLILQKHPSEVVEGGWVYKVFKHVSDWQPPIPVATWADEHGQPLPLTFGLVDLVNRLRADSAYKAETVEERNAKQLAKVEQLRADVAEAINDEHRARLDRGRVTVSRHRTSKRAWQRNHHRPKWMRNL